jgi:hypothetical protein
MKSSRESLFDRTGPFTSGLDRLFWATEAGALYAIIVFLIGFILGSIRVLLVAPRLGETIAVIIEAPVILAASWFVCRCCVKRLDVAATSPGSRRASAAAPICARDRGPQLVVMRSPKAEPVEEHKESGITLDLTGRGHRLNNRAAILQSKIT